VDSKKKILAIHLAASRESQKSQGYFDGRFVQRSEESKKKYNRKTKHLKKYDG
jgi:hypothetical protein